MRNRHLPRLCRDCRAPMAGHEDACWRCGAQWASEEAPRTTLRLIPAAAPSRPEHVPERRIAPEVGARTTNQMRLDAERWTNDGGSFASEVAAPLAAVSARLAVAATAFGSPQDARRAAADMRSCAGSASGAEES
jgi:hypothetical protein